MTKRVNKKTKQNRNQQLKNSKESFLSTYSFQISLLLVAILAIILYSNTFHAPFYYDDYDSILGNPRIRNLQNFAYIPNLFDGAHARFISSLSFALNFHFGGINVIGYHLTNIAIHLVNSILVMLIINSTFKTPVLEEKYTPSNRILIMTIAGLIFVSHPVQTQAITYIIQRMSSMSTMFYLLSMFFYINARLIFEDNRNNFKSVKIIIKLSILFVFLLITTVMGLWSKQTVATLPVMIFVYEIIFFRKKEKFNWKIIIPVFALFLVFLLLAIKFNILPAETDEISRTNYFITQISVIVTYLKILLVPISLNLDYEYQLTTTFLDIKTIGCFLLIIALIIVSLKLIRKQPLISFSILWYFIALSVESSFIPIRDLLVEHRLYLPMFGYALFISCVIFILNPKLRTIALYFLGLVLISYSVLTFQRNKLWNDPILIWTDTMEKSPHKIRPQFFRGFVYMHNKEIDNAIYDFQNVIAKDNKYYRAYDNLGIAYQEKHDYQTALKYHNDAIKIEPNSPYAYNNRASAYILLERYDEAIVDLNKAVEISRDYTDAFYNLGYVYFATKKYEESIKYFTTALELDPTDANIYNYLSYSYNELGNFNKAKEFVELMRSKGITPNHEVLEKLKL